jgi:hypothetical protein
MRTDTRTIYLFHELSAVKNAVASGQALKARVARISELVEKGVSMADAIKQARAECPWLNRKRD